MVLLLGCPAVGDGAVEQQRRKGKIKEGKKRIKEKKMWARDKRRKYQNYHPR